MTQTKINGKKLLDKLTDLGWDYQCNNYKDNELWIDHTLIETMLFS